MNTNCSYESNSKKVDLVSAIITTHNRYSLLLRAIDSVMKQTYERIELIVVDDASEINRESEIRQKYGGKITFIRIEKENSKGGNHARNIGIQNAKGKYIAFLDDDDIWLPNKITRQVEFLCNNSESQMVYCNLLFFNDKREWKSVPDFENQGDCSKICLYRIISTTSAIMCSKELINDIGGFDENLRFWQETDLVIRIAQKTKIGFVNEYLVRYYADENSKQRLTNKYFEWWKAVEYHNIKYANLISNLTEQEKKMRWLLIYHDAEARARAIKNPKELRKVLQKIINLEPKRKNYLKYLLSFLPKQGTDILFAIRNGHIIFDTVRSRLYESIEK